MKYLQTYGLNIFEAMKVIKTLNVTFCELESDQTLYAKADEFILELNVLIANDEYIKSTGSSFQIQIPEGRAKEVIIESTKENVNLFVSKLRKTNEELFTNEFSKNDTIFQEISHLDISNPTQWLAEFDNVRIEGLSQIINYKGDMSLLLAELKQLVVEFHQNESSQTISLFNNTVLDENSADELNDLPTNEVECDIEERSQQELITKCYCLECILKFIRSERQVEKFSNVVKLFEFIAIFPSTQVKCERDFSRLKIVKNRLRTRMTGSLLQNLMIISSEASFLKHFNLEDLIDRVAKTSRYLSEKLL